MGREVHHRRTRWLGREEKRQVQGRLPCFAQSLGLDIIISDAGAPVLIELQHGFGRRGAIQLFPRATRSYRKIYRQLRSEYGRSHYAAEEIRRICSDKIRTYHHFSRYQPRSMAFRRWDSTVESWLDSLPSSHVLAKPPRGSCGAGILVLDRQALRRSAGSQSLGTPPLLLQEFVRSRPLIDAQGRAHLGCIRHIVVMGSDGRQARLAHMPPYWRVSPVPESRAAKDRDALTANISRGAYPVAVTPAEAEQVRELAGTVLDELVRVVFKLEAVHWARPTVVDCAD